MAMAPHLKCGVSKDLEVRLLYPPPSSRRSFSEVGLRQYTPQLRRDKIHQLGNEEIFSKR